MFIHTEKLKFRYKTEDSSLCKNVIDEVNLDINSGEFIAIVGENGCGKSTLSKHFNAILLPSGGKVYVDGIDTISEADKYEIRRRVGLVLQNPENQIIASVVEEDVAFGPENLSLPPKEIRKRVDEALKIVNMYEYRHFAPHKLSGGQKQRIAIAGILAMKPKCIVLDEPTSMLDPQGREDVLQIITKLNHENGITVILITHFMDEATFANRVLIMSNGKIVMHGTPREVFSRPAELKRYSLEVPAATQIANLLHENGYNISRPVLTDTECASAICDMLQNKNATPKRLEDTCKNIIQSEKPKQNVFEIKNLSFVYGKGTSFEKTALSKLNISITENEFVGIIGHTGSGKSTFIQHLNGLLKPSSGEILFKGQNIWENPKKIKSLRFQVGLVFQYPEHQLFEETIFKDIAFGPKNMGLSENEIRQRVFMAADFVGLPRSSLQQSPFELSGGQKRRTAIAGVIAMDPKVLVLDEPTAGLDPKGRADLLNKIKLYQKSRGNTVILVSHSMEDIAALSDRVLVMNNGQMCMFGKTKDVFSHPEILEKIGMKVPSPVHVMHLIRKQGYKVENSVLTVNDAVSEIIKLTQKGV